MSGMVIIASDIPSIREVLTIKGKSGAESAAIFVKDWDSQSWIAALFKALKNNEEAQNTALQAQKLAPKIRALYSTENMLENYRQLYKDIV